MSLTLNGSSPAVTFPDGTTQSTAANITAPYTANGVVYASSTSALATGSNLSFDGNYTLALTNGTSGLLNLGPTAGQARIYSDSTGAFFGSSSSTPMIFRTNNTEYMRLTTSGYLGIGTSSPSYQLDVTGVSRVLSNNQSDGIIINGNDNSNVKLRLTNSGTGGESYNIQVGVTSASNSNLVVRCNTSSSDLLQLSQSGNLGLGAGPATWYSYSRAFQLGAGGFIQGRSNDATTLELGSNAYLNTSGNWTYPYTAASSKLDASNGTFRFNIAPSGTAGTTISYTQAMTLDNSGRLLIGTTSAADSTLRTQSGSSSTDGRIEAWLSTSNGGSYGVLQLGSANTGTNTECTIHFVSGATALGNSPTSANGTQYDWGIGLSPYGAGGNVFAVACTANGGPNVKLNYNSTAWLSGSDERIKNITGNIENALSIISPWRTIFYTLKSDESKDVKTGLIAQDVLKTLPEVVDVPTKELNDKGELLPLSIAYTEIIPVLVKAMQELNAEIQSLKAEVATLKGA